MWEVVPDCSQGVSLDPLFGVCKPSLGLQSYWVVRVAFAWPFQGLLSYWGVSEDPSDPDRVLGVWTDVLNYGVSSARTDLLWGSQGFGPRGYPYLQGYGDPLVMDPLGFEAYLSKQASVGYEVQLL